MAKYDNFKRRRKLEICPNSPKILAISKRRRKLEICPPKSFKNLGNFIFFFIEMWWFFEKISQKSPLTLSTSQEQINLSEIYRLFPFKKCKLKNFVQTDFRQYLRLFQFQKMQAQILLNGSPLITSSKLKRIALHKLGIRSPDYVLSRTRSSFQGYYYYYKPLAGIRTRRVRGRTPRVRASSTANSNEEELENSAAAAAAAAAGAEEVRLGFRV